MLLSPVEGLSQQSLSNADSLKKALRYDFDSSSMHSDTANILLLTKIAEAYRPTQSDSALKYARRALSLAEKTNYLKGTMQANYQIGRVYFSRGDYEEALKIANRSLGYSSGEKLTDEFAHSNQLAGMVQHSMGNYRRALEYFLQSKDLFEKINNEQGSFNNLNNIGVVYLRLEDYKKALEIFLELDTLKTLQASTITIPVNLGLIYYELGDYKKADANLNRVLNFKMEPFDQRAVAISSLKLGEINRDRGDYEAAITYFNQSIKVYNELDNSLKQVQPLNAMALTYLELGEDEKALQYASIAHKIARENNPLPEKRNMAETLYKIYDHQGKAEMALKYHEYFKEFSDSLQNDEVNREVGRLEAKNAYEKRELALKEQQKQQQLINEKQVAEQRTYLVILGGLLLASILGGYGLYRNAQVRKRHNVLLKEKNKEIKSQTKELKELNDVKNHLFSIISHDLRGPINSLHGIISLHEMDQMSNDEMERLMPRVAHQFKHTSNLLTNLLSWSRSQLDGYQTEPETFDIKKLATDILPTATHQAENKNIAVMNNIDHHMSVYADRSMIELVLLNLLSNAVKFTPEQGRIELSANQVDNRVEICVSDSGVGIPEDKIKLLLKDDIFYSTEGTQDEKGTGLGLMLCQDFIERNNGTMDIQSTTGSGSTFRFSIPAAKMQIQQQETKQLA
jgi:signal transduction histidine kinase